MQFGTPIYLPSTSGTLEKHQRRHFSGEMIGGNPVVAPTELIAVRSLVNVGGGRDSRRYTRKKNRKHGTAGVMVTAMMAIAAAKEITRRRARNKVAAESRRANRR